MRLILTVSAILGCGLALLSQTVAYDVSFAIRKVIEQAERNKGDASAEFLDELKIRLRNYFASKLRFDVGFYLYTPSNPEEGYNLQRNPTSLQNSPFNFRLDIKVIVHGYAVNLPKQSVFHGIKNELLQEGNYNVIIVDWTKHNFGLYSDVCLDAVFVGLEISKLIQFLTINRHILASSVHIIGHSLGAHIGGFVGKTTPNLGRISGLDAAGPIYQFLPRSLRLYFTDAIFVDAIHTNDALVESEGYGALAPYGDIDFFPNGGKQQPGCNVNDKFKYVNGTIDTVNTAISKLDCNHDRVTYLFLESIRNCSFLSTFCRSYSNFLRGECPPTTALEKMGFRAEPPSLPVKSKFFLKTMGDSPYCIA